MAYRIVAGILWVVWHLVFRIRTVGKEKIKGLKQYVLCPNHLSAADPLFVVLCRFSEAKMVVMGKEELFEIHPFIGAFFKAMGVIPVHRGKGDTEAVQQCIDGVKAGKGLLIFPEGTRSKTGRPGRIKSGAFVVAAAAGASLVPCRVMYDKGGPKLFSKVTVAFGDPVSCEELGLREGVRSAAALRGAKNWLAGQWEALYEANATPAVRRTDDARALPAPAGKEETNGDHQG